VKCAVVIARDNATRDTLNVQARQLRAAAGDLGPDALTVGDCEFRTGDRVIARRLDRVSLTVETDGGELRPLDVAYVADHLEHAYALTGHGAQGATVDWAAVVGRPTELTRQWAYTASAGRHNTRIHLICEPPRPDQDRARYAPESAPLGAEQSLKSLAASMRRNGSEPLALQQTAAAASPVRDSRAADGRPMPPPKEPDWRAFAHRRQQLGSRSRAVRL
jgi:hypothetical protein